MDDRAVYELCHLVNIADACTADGIGYEPFFFDSGRAVAASYRAFVDRRLAEAGWSRPGFSRTDDGVEIRYRERSFTIWFARMPLLVLLLEFLIVALSYTEVDDLLRDMLSDATSESAIRRASNTLRRRLYRYLSAHFPRAQTQRKFRLILEFLRDGSDEGMISIGDPVVLDFWRLHSSDHGGMADFRMFRTVFRDFLKFVRALELAESRKAVETAQPLGRNHDGTATSVGRPAVSIDGMAQWESPLQYLSDDVSGGLNLLTRRERNELSLLLESGPLSARLPLSLLLSETFGRCQTRIAQALRTKRAQDALAGLIELTDIESFRDREATLQALHHRVER